MLAAMVLLTLLQGVQGHGAVTKPMPRKGNQPHYCPWCVGEHHSGNPYGKPHVNALPSSPCLGTYRGDAHYTRESFGEYQSSASEGSKTYVAGKPFETKVVLNADHAGLTQWSYCPHFESETEGCFQKHKLTPWVDVHAYWGGDSTIDHWKDGQIYPQTVNLPNMPSGRVTLRWLWVCKYTDELFASCIDVDVVGTGSPVLDPIQSPTPIPSPTPTPSPTPVGDNCVSELWQQCGGRSWSGPTCCKQGMTCNTMNEWYSQCEPGSSRRKFVKFLGHREKNGAFLNEVNTGFLRAPMA